MSYSLIVLHFFFLKIFPQLSSTKTSFFFGGAARIFFKVFSGNIILHILQVPLKLESFLPCYLHVGHCNLVIINITFAVCPKMKPNYMPQTSCMDISYPIFCSLIIFLPYDFGIFPNYFLYNY